MDERGAADSSPVHLGLVADTVGRPGGIGRYSSELLAALGRRPDVRLVVAAPVTATGLVHELAGGNLDAMLPIPALGQLGIALWERYASGRKFVAAGAQIVHGTKHLVPRTHLPTVLTVHDLMTITRAHESTIPKRLFLPGQYRTSLADATCLVAASEATRVRLRALNPAWDSKTTVAPNGLSRRLLDTPSQAVPALADERFGLVVGDLAPRKNIGLLLDVWDEVARRTDGFRLVVLGNPGPRSDETASRLAQLEARGIARWLRGAPDGQLRWCYEHARMVLFPTLEEGFGFPVIEALTFHAPVLASTDPALMEVAAGSGNVTHLDPHDQVAWVDAISRAAAVPRPAAPPPEPPPGVLTWDQNAALLLPRYRALIAATTS